MRRIELWLLSCGVASCPLALAQSVYSGPFDYRQFQPSARYFAGHTEKDIDSFCSAGVHASTTDLEECSHRTFEQADAALAKQLTIVIATFTKADVAARSSQQPASLPYLTQSQTAWVSYRDNTCYAFAYANGPASARYLNFWECMTTATQTRTKELIQLLDG